MTVSVIIPAFNCAHFLEKMVDSIHRSGLNAHEILIIDDGSTDNTECVAMKMQDQYRNLRVVSQSNSGVSAARNRGIREAAGDYIYFADADDSLVSGSLADVNDILDAMRPDILMFGMVFDYYRHGRIYRSDALHYPECGTMSPAEWAPKFESLFAHNMLSPVWNKLIRRDLILKHQIGFREDMIEMEDYLFSAQCLLSSEQIYVLDKVVYRYRQEENEQGTFGRLWRIHSLSEYMKPFYETAEALEARFSKAGLSCKAVRVSDQIYSMLFHEQLRFARLEQIKLAAQDMLQGCCSDVILRADQELCQNLKDQRYVLVWCKQALKRARHRIAVLTKYRRSLRNNT